MAKRVIELTEEVLKRAKNFGALAYPSSKMALLLGVDEEVVSAEMSNGGLFADAYKQGSAEAEYLIDLKIFEMAKAGDLKALQQFNFRKKQFK